MILGVGRFGLPYNNVYIPIYQEEEGLEDLQIFGNKIRLKSRSNSAPKKSNIPKSTNSGISFDATFVSNSTKNQRNLIQVKKKCCKPNSGGVYRALVREKKKANERGNERGNDLPIFKTDKYSPRIDRKLLRVNKILYPNMTNFDPETRTEIIEKDETGYELTYENNTNSQFQNKSENIDVTSMAYLRNTYSHLHENQFLKLNQLLSDTENEELKLRRKQRINLRKGLYNEKSMEIEEDNYASESSFSSENSSENNEITEITKDMKNIDLPSDSKSPSKPIITFTPVRSIDEELDKRFHSNNIADRPPSSGSSSPLLEVPVSNFGDLTTEMMRPPING